MAEFIGLFIPKDILRIKELNLTEKCLLMQIIPLCVSEPCYASNSFFAERIGITETTASTSLKSLNDKGYIQTILDRKGGNKRTIDVFYHNDTLYKNLKDPSLKSLNTLFKNLKDPLKNSPIPYLNNLKSLFKNLNFIYKEESKEESKEENKEENIKEENEFSKNENIALLSENEFIKSELEKANEIIKALEENEKKGKQKSSAKKESLVYEFPEDFSEEVILKFMGFVENRKDIGKAVKTQRTVNELIEAITPFDNTDRLMAIRHSIGNGWTGIFPKKTNNSNLVYHNHDKNGTTSQISNSRHKSNWNAEEVARDAIAIATAHLR